MRAARGFTLIELMVVVTIVAVLGAVGYLSVNQLFGRQLDQDASSMQRWLAILRDRSMLEGAAYGLQVEAQQMRPLAYRQGYWLPLTERDSWRVDDSYQLSLQSDEELANYGLETEAYPQPDIVFLPDGTTQPTGSLLLQADEGASARLSWDAGGDFSMEIP